MKIRLLLFLFLIGSVSTFAQYQFKIGQKYHIFQYRANIREKPDINSDVLAILSIHDEVIILENSQKCEKINDVWGYWYKIKYGNIIGYTFGGNLAIQTIITDIDGNGINDYISYRLSSSYNGTSYGHLNNINDIKIYINNKRVSTEKLNTNWQGKIGYSILPPIRENDINISDNTGNNFYACKIKKYNGYILIELIQDEKCWTTTARFKIYPDGRSRIIAFIFDNNENDPENIFFEYLPNGTCKIISKFWNDKGYWTQ
jgi:hypothetical protein